MYKQRTSDGKCSGLKNWVNNNKWELAGTLFSGVRTYSYYFMLCAAPEGYATLYGFLFLARLANTAYIGAFGIGGNIKHSFNFPQTAPQPVAHAQPSAPTSAYDDAGDAEVTIPSTCAKVGKFFSQYRHTVGLTIAAIIENSIDIAWTFLGTPVACEEAGGKAAYTFFSYLWCVPLGAAAGFNNDRARTMLEQQQVYNSGANYNPMS